MIEVHFLPKNCANFSDLFTDLNLNFGTQIWQKRLSLIQDLINIGNQHFPSLNSTLEKWENERNEKKVVDLAAVHTEGDSALLTMAQ